MPTRIAFLALLILGMPAQAQSFVPGQNRGDTLDRMEEIARTPLDDFNIGKDDVPDKLFLVQFQPYDLTGLEGCDAIAAEIAELDSLLGHDVDLHLNRSYSAGDLALDMGSATLASLIPFRGLIRQISGAAAKDRRIAFALWHGQSRRAFLKGVGTSRGCAWPAARVPSLPYELSGF